MLGCFAAWALGAGEGLCILATFAGVVLGAVIVVLSQRSGRNKNAITFDIISLQ